MSSPHKNRVIDLTKRGTKTEAPRQTRHAPMRAVSKPARLRVRRRKQRLLYAVAALVLLGGIVGGLGFLSHAPRLTITDVSVQGAVETPRDAVQNSVESALATTRWKIFSNANIFLYPRTSIEKNLTAAFPRIKSVAVARPSLLAQAVTVSIEERKPYATWCTDTCFLMDDKGVVFATSTGEQVEIPWQFSGGLIPHEPVVGQTFLEGRFTDAVHALTVLKDAGYEAESFTVDNETDFSIQLKNGPVIHMLFGHDAEQSVRDLSLALDADSVRGKLTELSYIDMRFGNRVYYKFKDK